MQDVIRHERKEKVKLKIHEGVEKGTIIANGKRDDRMGISH